MKTDKKRMMADLAREIREQRRALGLTQQQLGEFAGCGVAFIYLVETGKQTVRLDKLLDVMMVLGIQFKLELGSAGIQIAKAKGSTK